MMKSSSKCIMVLVIITTVFTAIIELRYPYYFLQDDNYSYHFPQYLHAFRSLFHGGQLSLYNFHQFLGVPTLSMGQPAILYPFGYLSIGLSLLFTGSVKWFIDIFMYMHILAGVIGMFILLRHIKIREMSAMFGALVWGFSNFIWIVGTSWCTLAAIIAYLPLMVYFSLRLFEESRLKWALALMVVRVLSFYMGHPQFFVYACIAEFLTMVLVVWASFRKGDRPVKFIIQYLLSYIYTLVLSLPLLLPMFHQMQISAHRSEAFGLGWALGPIDMEGYLSGLLMFVRSRPWPDIGKLSYVGIIPVVLFVFYIMKTLYLKAQNKKVDYDLWIDISFKLIIFYLLWVSGVVVIFLHFIPILNRFRWAFKVIVFVNFFVAIFSAAMLDKISNKMKKWGLVLLIVLQIGGSMLALNVNEFFSFGDRYEANPYSGAEEILKIIDDDNKIIDVGLIRGVYALLPAKTLMSNFSTYYEKYNFSGYELMLSEKHLGATFNKSPYQGFPYKMYGGEHSDEDVAVMMGQMREWGVKWHITDNDYVYPSHFELQEEHRDDAFILYKDPHAKPMFYFGSSANTVKSYNIAYNEVLMYVEMREQDELIVNFFRNPFLRGYVNGERVDLRETDLGQILLDISTVGEHEILIKYVDPYFVVGCYVSGSFLLLLMGIGIINYLRWKL